MRFPLIVLFLVMDIAGVFVLAKIDPVHVVF